MLPSTDGLKNPFEEYFHHFLDIYLSFNYNLIKIVNQLRNDKMVYSRETALFLNDLSDRDMYAD